MGTGLIANDGNHEQLFSRVDYGDRVFRTAAVTKPTDKPVVMVGGDWVLEDDIGGYTDGHIPIKDWLLLSIWQTKTTLSDY